MFDPQTLICFAPAVGYMLGALDQSGSALKSVTTLPMTASTRLPLMISSGSGGCPIYAEVYSGIFLEKL